MEVLVNFLNYWEEASTATQCGIIAIFLSPFVIILLMGIMEKILERKERRH